MAEEKSSRAKAALGGEGKKPAKKAEKKSGKKDGKKKKKPHKMHIRRAANGGFITEHEFKRRPEEDPMDNEEYQMSDLAQLHGHLDENFTDDEEEEMEAPPAAMGGMVRKPMMGMM